MCRLYFDFVLMPEFKYKDLVGVLSSSFCIIYQGRIFLVAMEWEYITNLFCFGHTHYKVFFCYFLAYANLATILMYLNSTDEGPKCLETELTNITRRHFCSLSVLLSLIGIFFRYLFVLTYFDSSRGHKHATGTQIVPAKMMSLDVIFCRGNKSSPRSLTRFCCRKHKNVPLKLRTHEKIWARLVGKSRWRHAWLSG